MSQVTYELSRELYQDPASVEVHASDGMRLASIPLQFLKEGHTLNWTFVLECIAHCVSPGGGHLLDQHETLVDTPSSVTAGGYTYIVSDEPNLVPDFTSGPEGKSSVKGPGTSASSGRKSDSKCSSNLQNDFLHRLVYRDQDCLLTGAYFESCTPTHIVPVSHGLDLYTKILGIERPYLYSSDMGLLLLEGLHHAFGRGDWALYPRESDYVVHCFVPKRDLSGNDLHGMIIPFSRFHGQARDRPNARLLMWHYRQCVQMHFRGFSYTE